MHLEVEIVLNSDSRDLTVATDKSYGEIVARVNEMLDKNGVKAKISPVSIYQPDGEEKRITIHLEFNDTVSGELMQQLESL